VTGDPPVSGSIADAVSGPRLALRPEAPVSAHLDGAWWPPSTHLATELPGLVAKLSYRLGQVNLVGYHLDAWTETPPEIEIAGQTVELVGVTSDEPNSVVLVAKGHHIALLVIPPDTREQVAQQELAGASKRAESGTAVNQGVVSELAAKLARHEGSSDPQRLDEIRRWCEEAAEQFVDAPVQVFVPILIENIVRSRMDLHRTATTT
jgi:Family of unknown function (DUF5994)